jgi:hypothetical protein
MVLGEVTKLNKGCFLIVNTGNTKMRCETLNMIFYNNSSKPIQVL